MPPASWYVGNRTAALGVVTTVATRGILDIEPFYPPKVRLTHPIWTHPRGLVVLT